MALTLAYKTTVNAIENHYFSPTLQKNSTLHISFLASTICNPTLTIVPISTFNPLVNPSLVVSENLLFAGFSVIPSSRTLFLMTFNLLPRHQNK